MSEITVTVTKDGKIVVEAHGFKGNACEKVLRDFDTIFGASIESKKKEEYYLEEQATNKAKA